MIPFTVYYSLYTEDGDITPKHPINCSSDDSPSVARIDKTLVPPPHSPDSIIRFISYVEGFSYCAWHRLFTSVTSKSPINYMDAWVPERGGPGSTPDTPLIFVKFATRRQLSDRIKVLTPLHVCDSLTTKIVLPLILSFSIQCKF